MKLYHSPASPFARKVVASAIVLDLDRQIERVRVNPHLSPPELLAANPLSKIPCLVTSDGVGLFDSAVICAFLDSIGGAAILFPASGKARWRALKLQAMADGLLDAAVICRLEGRKPREAAREAHIARQKAAIARVLDVCDADMQYRSVDIGSLSLACALGYLDFRFADDPWRPARPKLAAWMEAFSQNPCIALTPHHE